MIVRVSELEESGLRIEGVEAFAGALSDPTWRLDAATLEVTPDNFTDPILASTGSKPVSRRHPHPQFLESGPISPGVLQSELPQWRRGSIPN